MRLLPRLVLGVLAAAVPAAIVATFWEVSREADRRAEVVRERTVARFEILGRDACEDAPESFPNLPFQGDVFEDWLSDEPSSVPLPPEPHVRYFVHDARLRAYRQDAPPIPRRARSAYGRGRDSFTWMPRRGHARLERTLVRMPWTSDRCAAVLVERPAPIPGTILARLVPATFVTVAVLLVLALVAGPVVVRIRRLIAAVNEGRVKESDARGGDELAELARAFRAREATIASQMQALEARESALREHLAATSHDVLLPITVLQGHLVELESALDGGQMPDARSVRGALEETHYVAALVRDLNAEARMRTGLVVRDADVDLTALVERAIARHRPLATRAGIELDAATPESALVVRGDPTLLEQMVSNLVHNSVRYVESGGHVAVILERTNVGFRLVVKDDGPGVADELLAKLGTRGFRTDDARTRRPEGMGLGLHIVREVAALHALDVRFERGEPTGLVVTIEGKTGEG